MTRQEERNGSNLMILDLENLNWDDLDLKPESFDELFELER